MNCTGNGAEDVETFDYFDLMDKVLHSRDTSTLRHVASSQFLRRRASGLIPAAIRSTCTTCRVGITRRQCSRFTTCKFPIAIGYKRWCHILELSLSPMV